MLRQAWGLPLLVLLLAAGTGAGSAQLGRHLQQSTRESPR